MWVNLKRSTYAALDFFVLFLKNYILCYIIFIFLLRFCERKSFKGPIIVILTTLLQKPFSRAFCIRAYYPNEVILAQRLYHAEFNVWRAPKEHMIRRWVQMFEDTSDTIITQHTGWPRSAKTQERIEHVIASVRENPTTSIRKRSKELNVPQSCLQRIRRKDLHRKPYKIQLMQELKTEFIRIYSTIKFYG